VETFLRGLPKAELHVHIEGTLEPEMAFEMAARNGVELPFGSVAELRAAYEFTSLQDFLDVYYEAAAVLRRTVDFYDLTWAYLERAAADGVRRAEISFDPQTHTERGIAIGTVIDGITQARLDAADDLGISSGLILCFLRHLSSDQAMATFEAALPYRGDLIAVGLDSSEIGHPPEKFVDVFARARGEGLHVVAHAGEEGPPEYVWGALDSLGAERIDHGNRALEDPELVARLRDEQVPLTVCPLSNVKLAVVDRLENHPLPSMIDAGLDVSLNSDDPAYFGGYVGDAYVEVQRAFGFERHTMIRLARNSIEASFAGAEEEQDLLEELAEYVED
jgi:adenosine deaminase